MVVWLHLMPMRPCLDVSTWEASLWCWLLRAYLSLFYSMWWYAYHACLHHPLAFYASLHTCLHVQAWVLLTSVSSMLQHNEVMDIWSKPTFVPRGHPLCVFSLLVCPICLLVSFLAFVTWCACLIYLFCLLCNLVLLSTLFPSIACPLVFLSLPLHVHIWSEDAWS